MGEPVGADQLKAGLFGLTLILTGPLATAGTTVDGAAIADEQQSANWLSYGRTYSEQRYSPLQQIDTANVAGLKLDWALELPGDRTLLATPIVVDGVMYISGSFSVVRAVEAALDVDVLHHVVKEDLHPVAITPCGAVDVVDERVKVCVAADA